MKIWAAVFGAEGTPAIGVYGTSKREVEIRVADRQANGEAFEGERVVWFANVTAYNARLQARNLPTIPEARGRLRGEDL